MLEIKRLDPRVRLPTRGTPNSIGLDLYAYLLSESGRPNTALIPPRTTRMIRTGIVAVAPESTSIFVCSRSGIAAAHSLFVTNAPGVVDPDYRGELMVLLYNGGHESYYVKHEDRIAQLVLLPVVPVSTELVEVGEFAPTMRGESGFGSTGR